MTAEWTRQSPLPPPPSLGDTYKPAPPMALHQQVHNLVYRQPAHPRHSHPSSLAPQTHPSPRRVRENAPSPSVSLQVKARVEDENPWPEPDHTPMFSRRQKSNDTPVTQHVHSSVGGQSEKHKVPPAHSTHGPHPHSPIYTQRPSYPPTSQSIQSPPTLPPPLALPRMSNPEVNRVDLHNPRQWGPSQQPPADHAGGWESEDTKNAQVGQWAENVAPISPPRSPNHSATAPCSPQGRMFDLPPRADSAKPVLPPVKVFVSDDESVSPGPLTPHQVKPKLKPSQVPRIEGLDDPEHPWEASDVDTSFDINSQRGGRYSEHGRFSQRPSGHRVEWWKDRHPVYSPLYTNHRFYVKLPFRVREPELKAALTRHFSRWGPLRLIFLLESDGHSAERAVIVYSNPSSVQTCFADDSRNDFYFQSTSFADATRVTIETDRCAPFRMSQSIYLRLSGPRPNITKRSSSRASSRGSAKVHHENGRRPLPRLVWVYARCYRLRNGRENVAVHVLEQEVTWSSVSSRILMDEGRPPEKIGEIDFSARHTEVEIVTRLCDFFGEILDVHPSASPAEGWVVRLSNNRDARRALSEMAKIPGVTARYANPADGDFGETPQVLPVDLPPLELERDFAMPVPRQAPPHTKTKRGPKSQRGVRSSSTPAPMPHSTFSPTDTMRPIEPLGPTSDVQFVLDGSPHPYHPILRRALVSVYKDNRAVVQEVVNGDLCHIDKRAIHVGRLKKGLETRQTLLSRFAKYGTIADIEFNPQGAPTTFATARILYQSREAAVRALTNEDGQVSFGSTIKVSERIVQDCDVRLSEMFVDTSNGLIIAPAAAEQYSPPSLLPDAEWLPPPPPIFPLAPRGYPHPLPPPGMFFMPMFASPAHASTDGHMLPQLVYPNPASSDGTAPQSMPMGMFCAPMPFPPEWYPPQPPLHLSPPRTPTPVALPTLPPSDLSPAGSRAMQTAAEGPSVLETKYVDGVFSIVYEPRELEAYCQAKGIRPEEMVFPHTLKA